MMSFGFSNATLPLSCPTPLSRPRQKQSISSQYQRKGSFAIFPVIKKSLLLSIKNMLRLRQLNIRWEYLGITVAVSGLTHASEATMTKANFFLGSLN